AAGATRAASATGTTGATRTRGARIRIFATFVATAVAVVGSGDQADSSQRATGDQQGLGGCGAGGASGAGAGGFARGFFFRLLRSSLCEGIRLREQAEDYCQTGELGLHGGI